jgi:hypothetical protein
MRLPTLEKLENTRTTKGELASQVYRHKSFDCTLPQNWLDTFAANNSEYDLLRGGTVWLYDGDFSLCGAPAPLTFEAYKLLRDKYREQDNVYMLEYLRELCF